MKYFFLLACVGCFSPASGYVIDSKDPLDILAAQRSADEWSSATGDMLEVRSGNDPMGGEFLISWGDIVTGEDGVIAYTYRDERTITLSDKETWFNGSGICQGFDMQTVIAHEMGHSLGRNHTLSPLDTMNQIFKPCELRHELTEADVNQ